MSNGTESAPFLDLAAKILIVDDVPSARKIVKRLLNKLGFKNIAEAASGINALEIIKAGDINLVISDWHMPEMEGIELVEKLRQQPETKKLPFIMITGTNSSEEVLRAVQGGVDDYVVKPFDSEILSKKIENALRKQD